MGVLGSSGRSPQPGAGRSVRRLEPASNVQCGTRDRICTVPPGCPLLSLWLGLGTLWSRPGPGSPIFRTPPPRNSLGTGSTLRSLGSTSCFRQALLEATQRGVCSQWATGEMLITLDSWSQLKVRRIHHLPTKITTLLTINVNDAGG